MSKKRNRGSARNWSWCRVRSTVTRLQLCKACWRNTKHSGLTWRFISRRSTISRNMPMRSAKRYTPNFSVLFCLVRKFNFLKGFYKSLFEIYYYRLYNLNKAMQNYLIYISSLSFSPGELPFSWCYCRGARAAREAFWSGEAGWCEVQQTHR